MSSHIRRWQRAIAIAALLLPAGDGTVPATARDRADAAPHPLCLTESLWDEKRARIHGTLRDDDGCARGPCDDPAVRDAAATGPMVVRLVVHVMTAADGRAPNGIDAAAVGAQVAQLNADFAGTGITFRHRTRFHADDAYYCIPAWSASDPSWFAAIEAMRAVHAEEPSRRINVYVSCQSAGPMGTLKGIGTFPWDPDALSHQGGVWINSAFFGRNNHTLTHEMGHALGLLHTHHANTAEACENACYERVHPPGDPVADLLGDFCADTPATPANYECADPPGRDCDGTPWTEYGRTDVANFMGYGPDWCAARFTARQRARMHCWTRGTIAGVMETTEPPATAGATVTLESHPNPANPSTTFRFTVPVASRVSLRVFDVHGHLVVTLLDAPRDAGVFELPWDGRDRDGEVAPSGVYYARVEEAQGARTVRVVLLK